MNIEGIVCDICNYESDYPEGISSHEHPELEIDGVPQNIWTLKYTLDSTADGCTLKEKKLKLKNSIPDFGNTITLGEGQPNFFKEHIDNHKNIDFYVLDESNNPSGSFKDRGMPFMVADAIQSGKGSIAIPSTGNAAISLAMYTQNTPLECIVFIPENTPKEKQNSLRTLGTKIVYDPDLIESYEHFFRFIKSTQETYNGFPVTNIPYSQGLKTISHSIVEHLQKSPDAVIIPCGSGSNIVAQYYGFKDMLEMGIIEKIPKLIPIQVLNADPITQGYSVAIDEKKFLLDDFIDSRASAIASDTTFNYYKIMNILKDTNSFPISVSDSEIQNASDKFGYNLEFSSFSTYAAIPQIIKSMDYGSNVVMINTARSRNHSGVENAK